LKENFLNLESMFILFGLTLFIFGSLVLGHFLFNSIFKSRKNNDENNKKKPSPFWKKVKVISMLFLMLTGITLCSLGVFIQPLIPVTDKVLIAEVFCTEMNTNDHTIDLVFVQKSGDSGNVSRSYFIIGEQWLLHCELIHWSRLVGSVGLQTNCRMVRIGGGFINQESDRAMIPSSYSLLPVASNSVWYWLHSLGSHLPLINRVEPSIAYAIPLPGAKYLIYATPVEISIESEIP